MTKPTPRLATLIAPTLLAASLALGACSRTKPVGEDEYRDYRTVGPERGKLGGGQGLVLGIGGKTGSPGAEDGSSLGVNAYLWRAALDTLSFMPLASADPFGGVIITDWYSPPAAQAERFKATAYILGRQLRADGIRVAIFRQVLQNGRWTDAAANPATGSEIEDKVLGRARELRSQSASGS